MPARSMFEMMGQYTRLHGVPPVGPHRPLADQLFAGAIGVCAQCHGTEQLTDATGKVTNCAACVMGQVVLKCPEEMDAIRAKIREQFPEVFASSPVEEADEPDPFPDLTLAKSLVGSLDDQALIDALVFEAWRTADEARSWIFGEELTSRWHGIQSSESDGILLIFDHEILDSDWEPEGIQTLNVVRPSLRNARLSAGDELTEEEIERCRDFEIEQHFESPDADCCWQVVPITSLTGNEAYLAHILKGDYPCECEFVGVFRSVAAAEDAFKQHGYVSLEQCRLQRGRVPPRNSA